MNFLYIKTSGTKYKELTGIWVAKSTNQWKTGDTVKILNTKPCSYLKDHGCSKFGRGVDGRRRVCSGHVLRIEGSSSFHWCDWTVDHALDAILGIHE
jgi:hypothetical protein